MADTNTDLNMLQLMRELRAAGLMPEKGIATPNGLRETLHTMDEFGLPAPLSPEAQAIIQAHVAQPDPVRLVETQSVGATVRTTDDTLTEAFRMPANVRTLYRVTMSVTAIDAGNGVAMDIEARAMFKRLNAGLVQVGTRAVLSAFRDTAAATWDVQPGVNGTAFTVSVKGALGRTIDWMVAGEIKVYAPDGLPDMPVMIPPPTQPAVIIPFEPPVIADPTPPPEIEV